MARADSTKTVVDSQLGRIPADESKMLFLDAPPMLYRDDDFVVCVDRDGLGVKRVVITTYGRVRQLCEYVKVRNAHQAKGKMPPPYEEPLLTQGEKEELVAANVDSIEISADDNLRTIDRRKWTYDFAEKVVANANAAKRKERGE